MATKTIKKPTNRTVTLKSGEKLTGKAAQDYGTALPKAQSQPMTSSGFPPAARGDDFAPAFEGEMKRRGIDSEKAFGSGRSVTSMLDSFSGESGAITASTFDNGGNIQVSAPSFTDYSGALAGVSAGMKSGLAVPEYGSLSEDGTGLNKFDPNTGKPLKDPNAFDFDGLMQMYERLEETNTPPNLEKIYAEKEKAAGIRQKQQLVNDYSAQLNMITAKAQAEQLSLEGQGRGITDSIIGGQQAKIAREAAIQALPVAAQLAAAQGNLHAAQQHLDTMYSLAVQDAQNQYQHKAKLISNVMNFANASEQRRLQQLDTQNAAARDDQKQLAATQNALLSQAIANNAPQAIVKLITASQTPQEAIESAGTYGTDMLGRQVQLANIEQSRAATRASNRANQSPAPGNVSSLTTSVIENPSLFDDLTPTMRGKVISELQANGYDTSNLGTKPLSDTAIQEIAQTQKALSDLDGLKAKLQENQEFIGPIRGFQALNPWSKARQVQADVDRVRQTVGKALEGGVLRKEDEEKYKKILATLTDTPETATYKIDALISSIQRNIEDYKALQVSGGRSLDVGAVLPKKGETAAPEDLRAKYNY